jgi:uncharacterized protein (TIGR02246 family)
MTSDPTQPAEMRHEEMLRTVRDVYFAYADAADAADTEAFADLFTDDCRFDGGAPSTGRARIARHAGRVLGLFTATSHHISNVRVHSYTADSAVATAAVIAWHRKLDGDTFQAFARYESTLRREGDRWRFSHHTIRVAGAQGTDGRIYLPVIRRDLTASTAPPTSHE